MRKGSNKPILEDLNSIHIKEVELQHSIGGFQRLNNGYWIETTSQRCNYGGLRYFFICPNCGKSVIRLYYHDDRLVCRKCTGGRYWTENRAKGERIERKIEAIRAKLGTQGTKPKGMHSKTYERLTHELESLNQKSDDWKTVKSKYEEERKAKARRHPKHKRRIRFTRKLLMAMVRDRNEFKRIISQLEQTRKSN